MIKIILNPFERYSEKQLVITGILTTMFGSFLAILFNARFDGVLDLHFVEKVKTTQPIVDILIDFICLSTLLFLIGKYINKKTRFIDIISTTLISKIPFYILLFQNINSYSFHVTDKLAKSFFTKNYTIEKITSTEIAFLISCGILNLAFVVWSIALLFNGFKIATNAKTTKSVLLFIAVLILSELISKILISKFN
ncbi:YIP1 family protein [Flavobacterium sp. SUN052]|uniref:YIP1 family protein n=1 Tax=Flavobacterium sp. SUN052 TaxID=3002441 RepID=UPI00237DA929|nr:YIP1 family protein [Flavobacterium sp. SUN052]MEC4005286.1 YIP1 family protein [Flavobacterium sp. SUN052]